MFLVMKRQYGFQSTEKQIFEISQYTSNMMVEISRKLYYLIGEY